MCSFSLLGSTVLPPSCSTVQKVSMSIFVKDFANSVNVFFLKIFFVQESTHKLQRSYIFKSNCWNEIREMPVFLKYFENQAFLVKDPTYDIQHMQFFDCLVFWKYKLTRYKIKIVFLWFLVSILTSNFRYVIWWYMTR